MKHASASQHPPYQQTGGDHAAGDRAPREPITTRVLRCLYEAAPGLVTHRYLRTVVGINDRDANRAASALRRRYPVISHHRLGFSLAVKKRRNAEGSSLCAALSVSEVSKAVLHGQKLNGDAS